MYQTYIFDLYGTLIDIKTDEEHSEVWGRLALHFGYQGLSISGENCKNGFYRSGIFS